MADQSQFSKLPKKQLVVICDQLIDNNFDSENPYDNYYDSIDILQNIVKYFGMDAMDEDVQFFAKLIQTNDELLSKIFDTKDKSLYHQLVIPVPEEYTVWYSMVGSCTYKEKYETNWTSYDKDWVKDSMYQMRSDGNWDLYEGTHIDTEYDNFDFDDYNLDEVRKISDYIDESKNKNTIINSLDKKTLLELRGLIDNRLRIL